MEWDRVFLPEHLWIDLLADYYGDRGWRSRFHALLDALQVLAIGSDQIIRGYISDFALVPADLRHAFLQHNHYLVLEAFYRPAGRLLRVYPDCPASWLCDEKFTVECPTLELDEIRVRLTESVMRLYPGKREYAGDLRIAPFERLLKAGKLVFPREFPLCEVMERYPDRCSEAEKREVQQFGRTSLNALLCLDQGKWAWPKQFWRSNRELVSCAPHGYVLDARNAIDHEEVESLKHVCQSNAEFAQRYLQGLSICHKYDLYEPQRDEVLLGLFSRLTRLYTRIAADATFWVRDIGGIMLRCLIDTGITFAYLAHHGTEEAFRDFVAYGEGKQKLLMLHLQDNYPDDTSFDAKTPQEIAEELGGGLAPEMIDIELDNWTKKKARQLSIDAGLEKYYRLAYDPASADVHGTWMSLQHSNLTRCVQPLHRFHRLPGVFEPPAYIGIIDVATRFYEECLGIGVHRLGFPVPNEPLQEVQSGQRDKRNNGRTARTTTTT